MPSAAPSTTRERDLFGKEPPGGYEDWSHRKREPRALALMWLIFLMVASAAMFSRLSIGYSITPSLSRPAATEMLAIVIAGASVLYPMLRLSQALPMPSAVASGVRDWFVLVVPLQAVLWPNRLVVLGGWSGEVVLTLGAHGAAWITLGVGIVAVTLALAGVTGRPMLVRTIGMGAIILTAFAAPVLELLTHRGAGAGALNTHIGWMLSPVTGVLEITRDRSVLGAPAVVTDAQLRIIAGIACVGLGLVLVAGAIERRVPLAERRMSPYA